MKYYVTFFLLLTATLLNVGAQEVVFDKTTHDFGTIEERGGMVSHTFSYTNETKEPLVIFDVYTTCGCTMPKFSKTPLLPTESAQITITYDPINRPGRIAKSIRIVTNQGAFHLLIDGTVNPRPRSIKELYPFQISGAVRIDNLGYSSLQVPLGSHRVAEVGIANSGIARSVVVSADLRGVPQNVEAKISGGSLLETLARERVLIQVEGVEYGEFSYEIPLIINGKRSAEKIIVAGAVVDNFGEWSAEELKNAPKAEFSTHFLRVGRVELSKRRVLSLKITNKGGGELIIRQIRGSSDIDAEIRNLRIGAGRSEEVKIIYTPSIAGYDSQSLRFIVNDPLNPTPELRIVAEVL